MENSRPIPPALPDPPPLRLGVVRTLVRLALVALLALGLHFVFVRAEGWIMRNDYDWAMPGLMLAVLVIYALLIAIPFVPGVEIGLSLAFVAGSTVPIAWLRRVLTDLHMIGAAHLVARFEALPQKRRVAFARALLPGKYCGWIVKYRYVNLAVLINIPGNSVIGGGGGIAFVSGLSGTFRTSLAILTIALATAPVPLAIWLFGLKLPWV
jgi:hypothetical protein